MRRLIGLIACALIATACQQQQPDPRIGAIADRLAIDQLVAGDYPRALDARDWDAYAATYTQDGEIALGDQSAKGRDGIKAFVGALPADPRVIHVISNLSYEIAADAATGGAYWQDIGLVDGKPGVVVAGHYDDELRKVNGKWLFSKRSIVTDFQAPNEAAQAPSSQGSE